MGGAVMSDVRREIGSLFYIGDKTCPIFGFVTGLNPPEAVFLNMDPWREQEGRVSIGRVPMEGVIFLDEEELKALLEESIWNDTDDDRFILMIAEVVKMMARKMERLQNKN